MSLQVQEEVNENHSIDYSNYSYNRNKTENESFEIKSENPEDEFKGNHAAQGSPVQQLPGERIEGSSNPVSDTSLDLSKTWKWNEDAAYAPIVAPVGVSISSLDRTIDPSLDVVYRCWICDDLEFDNKLGIIRHLKECHADIPGMDSIEKRMRVSICMTCGVSGGCEHRLAPEDEEDDGQDDEDVDGGEHNSESKSRKNSSGDEYPCSLCSRTFPTSGSRSLHYNRDHPKEKAYQCIYCPEAFHTHHKLVVHTRTHTGYKPYVCGICGSKFPKNSDLNRHSRTHTGEKPFQCAQCGKQFTQRSSLQKHAKRHADKTGGYPCYHCGLTFQEEHMLDEHTKTDHGERTWKCKSCGKLFEERRHLFVHEKIHKEQETFACSFCGRLFTKRHQLLRHEERIHRCKDELKCKICDKEFRRRENLNRHMNIHLDKREFQCTECGMAFTEKGSLKRHILSRHEQYRPFQCRICWKTFSRRFLVRKHHERVHKSYPFECAEVVKPNAGSGQGAGVGGEAVGNYDGGGMPLGGAGLNDGVGDVVAAIVNESEHVDDYSERRDIGNSYEGQVVDYTMNNDSYGRMRSVNNGAAGVGVGHGLLRGEHNEEYHDYHNDGHGVYNGRRSAERPQIMAWNNHQHAGRYGSP